MNNTFITFVNKYYEYRGDTEGDERGLTTGGFESAWLADLVASYILKKKEKNCGEMKYYAIYHDDGFMVFEGHKSKENINEWLLTFQRKVDKCVDGNYLQFTAKIWGIEVNVEIRNKNLTIVINERFPYLDMGMYWNEKGELKFQVHFKSNQKFKYLNANITHVPSTFKAIPAGVINRLSKLTSMTKTSTYHY